MMEPSARPSASRTRAFFTAAHREIKAWQTAPNPESNKQPSHPSEGPDPPSPKRDPHDITWNTQHSPLTWVLNGHHLKATWLNQAPLSPHWCWRAARRRREQSVSSPPCSPRQHNIQSAPHPSSSLLLLSSLLCSASASAVSAPVSAAAWGSATASSWGTFFFCPFFFVLPGTKEPEDERHAPLQAYPIEAQLVNAALVLIH